MPQTPGQALARDADQVRFELARIGIAAALASSYASLISGIESRVGKSLGPWRPDPLAQAELLLCGFDPPSRRLIGDGRRRIAFATLGYHRADRRVTRL